MNTLKIVGESSRSTKDKTIIKDMVIDISDDDKEDEFISQQVQSFTRTAQNIQFVLSERMCFSSKEATVYAIKQYHIDQGYKFMVVESKTNIYVARCIHYDNGCQWRIRASFSKIRHQWEIKKVEAPHTCLSIVGSDDHINLDSIQIASIIFKSVKANPSISIKSLIAEIKNRHGYSVTYRKAWLAKQKVLAMKFGDEETNK